MKRLSTVLLVGLGAASLVGAGSAGKAPPTPKGLLLWNTLGSTYEVTHSAFGPNLALFNCHARRAPHFGPRCSIDIRGKLAFVDGASSKAATIGGGPYFPEARVHTALLRKSILNPEHGAIEAWYWQKKDPEPFQDNPHRIFAGGYNLGRRGRRESSGAGPHRLGRPAAPLLDLLRPKQGKPDDHLGALDGRPPHRPSDLEPHGPVDPRSRRLGQRRDRRQHGHGAPLRERKGRRGLAQAELGESHVWDAQGALLGRHSRLQRRLRRHLRGRRPEDLGLRED